MKTKRFFPIFLLVILSMLTWQGCTETEVQKGSIDFGMNPQLETALKSADVNRYDVVGALVSITGDDGVLIYDKELLHFYSFGEAFVTEKLKLEAGHFQLSEFLLVDSSMHVLWATPLEGSRLAHLVDDPLPIDLVIEANTTTHVKPEVVWVGNQHPGDFGYVSFDVQFVEGFCLGVLFKSSCDNWYSDSVWTTVDGDYGPVFQSKLLVYAGDRVIVEEYLVPGYNKLLIPPGFKRYTIVVIDCHQEKCFTETFNSEELRQFSCREGEPLYIHCGEDIIITPEDVLEPTIKQGVFGRLTIPMNDSSSWCEDDANSWCINERPVVRNVHLYRIEDDIPIYDLIETDSCMVFPIIDRLPDVIVRSNSSGYFQAELEAGTYLYMVETNYGYYIDQYISSRRPGKLIIEPEEVTILNIMIQPCYYWVEPLPVN